MPASISALSAESSAVAVSPGVPRLVIQSQSRTTSGRFRAVWIRSVRLTKDALAGLPPSTWLLLDLSLLAVAVWIGFCMFPPAIDGELPHVVYWQAAAVFTFCTTIASMIFGLYERETLTRRSLILTRMLLTTATAATLAYAIIYAVMYSVVSRRIAGVSLSAFLLGGMLARLTGWWAVHSVQRGLLVVGSRSLLDSFRQAQAEGFLREYRLVGQVTPPGDGDTSGRIIQVAEKPTTTVLRVADTDTKPWAPTGTSLWAVDHSGESLDWPYGHPDAFQSARISDIVIAASTTKDRRIMNWVVPAMQAGCRVTNEATFYEKATGQILVDEITPDWFLFADLKVHCDQHATFKRMVDMALAGLGLCVSAPLWPLIALAVKLGDGGPVFYYQDRVGEHGRVFRLYKFRTMRVDAENGKSVWATPADPRVTRFGRILRRSRLDELPQLWNVLAGQMSVVGPRPERPDIVRELCEQVPYYSERHLVKPGVTGWAQINFRYGASVQDAKRKLQFDLYYLKHMSFELDAAIILRTIGTFLRGGC